MHQTDTTPSRLRTLGLALLGAVLAAAMLAPGALAATQRLASPTGSGTDCSSAKPCAVEDAIGGANPGDEVIVTPGDYPLTDTLWAQPVTIHGVAGRPRPRLLFSGPGQKGLRMDWGGTLRHVEIDQAGAQGALFVDGGSVDQVIAKASGAQPTATVVDSSIRNSLVVTSDSAPALETGASGKAVTTTLRNVTAIATGGNAVPIAAGAINNASTTVHLVNVIAYTGPGAVSLKPYTDDSGAVATITATHTNYQAVNPVGLGAKFVSGGGNHAEEPVFVNPAAGDYRQAPGAYTIDAGLDEPINGAFDVDGDPRRIGVTDIGADEFSPAPAATTGGAVAVTDTSAPPVSHEPTTLTTTPAFAGVRLVSTRLSYARGSVVLRLRCPAATVGRCSGRTRLTARHRRPGSPAARRIALGRAGFSIAAGRQAKLRVRPGRAGRRVLSRAGRLRGAVSSAARSGAGESKTTVAAVTIRRRR